jgi:hypothetical protein
VVAVVTFLVTKETVPEGKESLVRATLAVVALKLRTPLLVILEAAAVAVQVLLV